MMNSAFIASCISAMAMSSELLREKFDNFSDNTQDLQAAQAVTDQSETDMISALMQEILDLKSEVNEDENRMDYISSEVDFLNSKSIVEDFFWTNPEVFQVVKIGCYDAIDVDANETFDFSANLSLLPGPSTKIAYFAAWIKKDGEVVAHSADDKGKPASDY